MADIALKFDIPMFEGLTKKACDKAAEKAAKKIMADSKAFIKQHAKHPTGKLASEIELKASRFKGGGWAVMAQGPGNYDRYYATFVELGSIHNPQPMPYLRTPLKANKNFILKQFEGIV